MWLTRAQVFAKVGWMDKMASDLTRAAQLKGDDPRPWVEAGRLLAEVGDQKQADEAYARAAELARGEVHRFLEPGWWVVGPYPGDFDLRWPPEYNADPAKPVAGPTGSGNLKWKLLAPDSYGITTWLRDVVGSEQRVSVYALAHVYSEHDRTAAIQFRPGDDCRVWVNGRVVFDGLAAWRAGAGSTGHVPVSLKAGRNSVLVKVFARDSGGWFQFHFDDTPFLKGTLLARLGLWQEAADVFASGDRRAPLYRMEMLHWVTCLKVLGKEDEYRKAHAEMIRRYDTGPGSEDPQLLVIGSFLPPEQTPQQERWIGVMKAHAEADPKTPWRYRNLAQAYYLAGRFAEAETAIRDGIKLDNRPDYVSLLVLTLIRQGKTTRPVNFSPTSRNGTRRPPRRRCGPHRSHRRWPANR